MPTKFKPSEKVYKRGVKASKLKDKHFYIKDVAKAELFLSLIHISAPTSPY